jgi:hypothetical protein
MERERFDGADIAHILLKCGERIDWKHLLGRFDAHWRVLLSHRVLFGFIYPSRRGPIPRQVMDELLRRVDSEQQADSPDNKVCNGTFLSRNQFISDIEVDGFMDGRLGKRCTMTPQEIKEWTVAGTMEQPNQKVQSN